MRIFITLTFLVLTLMSSGQDKNTDTINTGNNDEEIYTIVEEMPQFGESKEALQLYIQKNSKYSTLITRTQTTKNVFVKVVIEKDGKINFEEIARGVNEKYDSEAKRIIQSMPNWSPGQQKGIARRTYMIVPVWFE
jgi:hypothetical protein